MRPDCVVCEVEFAGEFLNRTRSAPQISDNSSARALEKAFIN
jgi:hypothetical protein